MKITRITSNHLSFHPIEFKNGINIIVAKQKEPHSSNLGQTYNGVGKTLLLHLIHFCLGSKPIKQFEEELSGWTFRLDFSHEGKNHYSERAVNNHGKIIIDGVEYNYKEGNEVFKQIVLGEDSLPEEISWRSLFSRYVRRYRDSYNSFDSFVPNEKDYQKLLNNSYLLGLDTNLIIQKKNLKEKLDSNKKSKDSIKRDDTFRKYFVGDKDPAIAADSLRDEITKIEKDISSFQVSENYHEMQSEADTISRKKQQLENKCFYFKRRIDDINQSLSQHISSSDSQLLEVYKEAKVVIPEMVVKEINSVEAFHNNLIASRDMRLRKQLEQQEHELADTELLIKKLGEEMDSILSYLDTHGALEEYVALTKKLSEYQKELSKIEAFQLLQKEFEDTARTIKSELINSETKAAEYLEKNAKLIKGLSGQFRSYAKEFYPGKASGLSIVNNSGDNLLRYTMDAKIQDDSSDGINSVKIFCFDLLILLSSVSQVDFVFHDSRLFSDMDPRQRETLFRIADKICSKSNKQYICTINEEQIRILREQMDEKEYESLITNNTMLELTDDSAASKLLGVQVDLTLE